MSILVADDSPVERQLLYRTLTSHGFSVILASDGAQAWKILSDPALAPRIAILDMFMPELDGLKLCSMLRGQEPSIYVVMVTSEGDRAQVLRAFQTGVDDFITKPFDPLDLKARVDVGRRIVQMQQTLNNAMEALKFQATHDGLTCVLNHSSIVSELERELHRARRNSEEIGVLLFDLDFFKKVNDQHGHLAGDEVLAEVALRLKTALRTYDSVGRYGGEEFLVILPETDQGRAADIAQRLRQCISDRPVRYKDVPLVVTASVGVSVSNGSGAGPKIIEQADTALYQAKRNGRNRIEIFTGASLEARALSVGEI
jgi:diguanylate cyclase (GGDEF)-like protein